MGILSKRNAVLGWAVWKLGKRAIKRKARAAIPVGGDVAAGPSRLKAIVPALAALGGALWFWRRRGDDDAGYDAAADS